MFDRMTELLQRIDAPHSPLRPTALYNEGWLLKLVLDWCSARAPLSHPFAFFPNARWFSEALLPSHFLATSRGDALAESWTHTDGTIGHVQVGTMGKPDLHLEKDATQLVVVEAKMFSGLSAGTKTAPGFDQAARTVACMAELLARAERHPDKLQRLAFYVVAPAEQIERKVFGDLVKKESIHKKVAARVQAYEGRHNEWFHCWFEPTLARTRVDILPWEWVLPRSQEYRSFYENCLKYNRELKTGHPLETSSLTLDVTPE